MENTTQRPPSGRLGTVFYVSVAVCALFVLWGVLFTENLSLVTSKVLDYVTSGFGWLYLVATLGLLVFVVYLAFSRYGKIRLGKDDDRPEFRTYSWLAMILSATMGIGLISYGVAEPISHFSAPPHGLAKPGTEEAAVVAMQYSYFDWGLHAWAVFAVFGLAIAYSTHRKGRRGLVSPMFYPILGDRVEGPIGKAIDVLAIFATLFGTTTSLGLGALQINGGLNSLFGVPNAVAVQVAIVAVVTVLFTFSAITGVHRGIRFLSETATGLGILLFVFLLILGPTVFLINLFVQSVGVYLNNFIQMSLQSTAFGDLVWMQWWTYFMLSWWIAWGAFVGVFLARISRGRTIREFILGVLVAPSLMFFSWFTVFGGTAIHLDLYGDGNIAQITSENLNAAIFATLDAFPLSALTSVAAIVLVVLFFVSGADANTFVLSMLSSDGVLKPKTPVLVLWGTLTGLAAVVLLLAGGLQALQQMVIISAAPFVVIIIGLCYAFWKELRDEPVPQARQEPAPQKESVGAMPVSEPGLTMSQRQGASEPR